MSDGGRRDATQESPRITKLTRRGLVKYGLLGTGVAAAGAFAWFKFAAQESDARIPVDSPAGQTPKGYKRLELCNELMPSPAFWVRPLPAGGLLTWVRRKNDTTIGYELNAQGRFMWRLCNGARSLEDICSEYAGRTGRPVDEARAFLADLRAKGLIVRGGHVVTSRLFPDQVEGGRYLRILGDDEEWMRDDIGEPETTKSE